MANVKIKAIFFDIGGVLAVEGFSIGIRQYECLHGIKPGELYAAIHDHSYWKDFSLGKISEEGYFKSVKDNFTGDLDVEELRNIMLDVFAPNKELVEYLKKLTVRYTLGIISNHPKEWFDRFFKLFKFNELFKIKAISGYLHVRKPSKKIFEKALLLAVVKPREAIYIDDREEMTKEAADLGINIIVYKGLSNLKEELKIFKVSTKDV